MNLIEIKDWLINLVYVLIPLCVITLIVFTIDTMTGIYKAKVNGTFCSAKLKQGISKALIYYGLILVMCCIDFLFAFYVACMEGVIPDIFCKMFTHYIVSTGFTLFIIIIEVISIIENAKEVGIDIPNWIVNMLSKIHNILVKGKPIIEDESGDDV